MSTRAFEKVFIGLGGNLGDPLETMQKALQLIDADAQCRVEQVSSFWRTPPWGKLDQPDFINACAEVATRREPQDFLALCLGTEKTLKRVRHERWGPRTLDIDILLFGSRVIEEAGLKVPHPRICERAFVLAPLAEIAGSIVLDGMTISARAQKIGKEGMQIVQSRTGGALA